MEDLNNSHHLTLSLELVYAPCVGDTDLNSAKARLPRVDWDRTRRNAYIAVFMAESQKKTATVLEFHL